MRQSAETLQAFYGAPLGVAARDMGCRRLSSVWPDMHGQDVLALGFPEPFLSASLKQAKRNIVAMPGEQGARVIKSKRGCISCLVDERALPFEDACFDNVLVVHAMEETSDPASLLDELWRVTRPEGKIIIIAANRAGLWARADASPFGAGRPYSHSQLRTLLRRAKFEPTFWAGALYTPPLKLFCGPRMRNIFEKFGETVWPGFSGLVMVEAVKRIYVDNGTAAKQSAVPRVMGTAPVSNSASRE